MAILLSIRPKHLVNILNRETTIVLLKSQLPLNVPVYLYCTKRKPYLVNFGDYEHPYKAGGKGHEATILNGKVVAKCIFSKKITLKGTIYIINQLEIFDTPKELGEFYKPRCKHCDTNEVCMIDHHKYACVYEEGDYNPYGTNNVFMCCKPKERLSKAPTTWCKVEVEE